MPNVPVESPENLPVVGGENPFRGRVVVPAGRLVRRPVLQAGRCFRRPGGGMTGVNAHAE